MLGEELGQLRIPRHVVGTAHQAGIAPKDLGHRVRIRAQDVAKLLARIFRSLHDRDGVEHAGAVAAARRRPWPGCRSRQQPEVPG